MTGQKKKICARQQLVNATWQQVQLGKQQHAGPIGCCFYNTCYVVFIVLSAAAEKQDPAVEALAGECAQKIRQQTAHHAFEVLFVPELVAQPRDVGYGTCGCLEPMTCSETDSPHARLKPGPRSRLRPRNHATIPGSVLNESTTLYLLQLQK